MPTTKPSDWTASEIKAERHRRRRVIQWGRRGNQVTQNVVAAVWAWSIPESQLRIYYDMNMYDKILLFHTLQLISLIFFFWASCMEPGFLGPDPFKPSNPTNGSTATTAKKATDGFDGADHEKVGLLTEREDHDDIDVEKGNVTKIDLRKDVPMSFCRNCEFLRPIRSKHCYLCDRCVPRFDHHCPILQQCVGARNYRQFYALVFVQSIVSGWSLWMAKDLVFYNEKADDISTWGWCWRIALFCWMLYQTFAAVGLAATHFYLISTAQTTFEFLRPRKLMRRIAFEREQGRFLDIASKRKDDGGFAGMITEILVTYCGCLFECYYPFSEGFFRNWYGFITGESLERSEYLETGAVVLVKSAESENKESKGCCE